PDGSPDPIPNGNEDVVRFLRGNGFDGDIKFYAAMRDESLNRRYYRVRIESDRVEDLLHDVMKQWTFAHVTRKVHENDSASYLPHSRNLPKWWKSANSEGDISLMLEHGGKPNWYIVINDGGEVDLIWTGR